jgi:SulP family sulfate permease
VVVVGVEQAILLAIVMSLIEHLRHSYRPHNTLLVHNAAGHLASVPVPDQPEVSESLALQPGLVVYRFGASLYYANADRLETEVGALTGPDRDVAWFCLDGGPLGDVDFSAGETLRSLVEELTGRQIRFVVAQAIDPVRQLLDRFGITDVIGEDAYFDSIPEMMEAFEHRQ